VFTAASLWCGLADDQAMLIAARFVQGVGGAMTTAVVLGMITTMFPSRRCGRGPSAATRSRAPRARRPACWPAA
jgi:MFS family permease